MNPYDIEWTVTDPLDRRISMYKSIVDIRQGKHSVPPEYLPTDEVKELIADPDRIDESSSHSTRDIYYKEDTEKEFPYARAVVDFEDAEDDGCIISWSRYKHPVSSYRIKYRKE
ncbi:hypothetical protein QP551_04420 [Slackia exigua]|uniref:hypothetical protein n=1 Tax=Slackia exigua TaxID=84109 RepID=UPI00254FB1D7|nr:hypothetical protein [Slackia exigua]MDK7723942.1 hypothetical protein [Slackia exigua]MDK7725173.1 hypothetical protein [Slackia exigua]